MSDNGDIDLAAIDSVIEAHGQDPGAVIPILQGIQELHNYLPEAALRHVCKATDITAADIAGVSTFYSQFRHRPAGRHTIKVCVGTACHVKGASRIFDAVKRHLGIPDEEDTDNDLLFTVAEVACLGCCTLAPAVQIDETTYGHLTPPTVGNMIDDFLAIQSREESAGGKKKTTGEEESAGEIRVGLGSCCIAGGSQKVRQSLEAAVNKSGVPITVKPVGCVGMCHQTPLVEVVKPDGESTLYAKVPPHETARIVKRHFKSRNVMDRVKSSVSTALDKLLTDEAWTPVTRYSIDVRDAPVCAFIGRQKHIAAEHCGVISPLDLEEYLKFDGFKALAEVLEENDPQGVVETIKDSGLRGRGGAGFTTGMKWEVVRAARSAKKYLVMNGDEGDPGAFMDRMLLESYPYRILEGLTIAAFAVGAHEGVLYIRAEYPLAVQRIRQAIAVCEEKGYLGDDILESGFSLRLRVMEGAGAFVCGEETALLASIEGRRGMPRIRPPFPAESGLLDTPTLINNVETYACVPWVMRHGPEAFAELGSGTSKGSKVFSLTGKVLRGGLIEVPMGISIGEIVEQIGGGVAGDREFKAVQIGGPSGGCIPASQGDTPIDFEALTSAGAMMGSGGLVVLDNADCMVDIARYFLQFTQEQSCGKCTFCRVGTKRMLEILERLCRGEGKQGDIDKLEELAEITKAGSLCGLGRTAPNPVLSTIRYFRDEYEAHIDGWCPAGKCPNLIAYAINDKCIGCTKCAQRCPVDAIPFKPYEQHEVDTAKCIRCDTCRQICPVDGAVEVISEPPR